MRLPSLMLVAAAVATTVSASCAGTMHASAPVSTPAGVRFVLIRPEARTVALTGSFNQWSTSSHTLTREGPRGPWTLVVALAPGEHLFMYVIDGTQWISPPQADDFVDDGFGSRNGVVVVRPTEK